MQGDKEWIPKKIFLSMYGKYYDIDMTRVRNASAVDMGKYHFASKSVAICRTIYETGRGKLFDFSSACVQYFESYDVMVTWNSIKQMKDTEKWIATNHSSASKIMIYFSFSFFLFGIFCFVLVFIIHTFNHLSIIMFICYCFIFTIKKY